jgi:hypothetical protein
MYASTCFIASGTNLDITKIVVSSANCDKYVEVLVGLSMSTVSRKELCTLSPSSFKLEQALVKLFNGAEMIQ